MPITGQPTFEPRDIPTVTQMNAWAGAAGVIYDKFNANLDQDDLEWPLQAGGHLDLDGNELLGLAKFGSRYNIQARRTWQTAQMVFDEVEARGGGAVFLPANSTLKAQTDPQGKSGVKIGNNTVFYGTGHSSVTQKLYLEGKSEIVVMDMQIDGFSLMYNCQNIRFIRCNFTATSGNNIMQMEDCEDVVFDDCFMVDTATNGIIAYNCPNLIINNCGFTIGDPVLIRMSAEGRPHIVEGCYFAEPSASAEYTIDVIGVDATQIKGANTTISVVILNPASRIASNILMDGGKVHYDGVQGGKLSANIFESVAVNEYTVKIINPESAKGWTATSGSHVYGNVIMDNEDTAMYINKTNSVGLVANVIYSTDEALVISPGLADWVHQTYQRDRSVISHAYLIMGNSFYSEDAALPALGLWYIVETGSGYSTDYWQSIIMGNTLDSAMPHGLAVYTDNGVTDGGRIGKATDYDYFFIIAGNMTPGTVLDGGAAGSDIDHNSSSFTVALDADDTGYINNI